MAKGWGEGEDVLYKAGSPVKSNSKNIDFI